MFQFRIGDHNSRRRIVDGKIDESFVQDIEHLESIRKVIAQYMAEGKADSIPSLNDVIPIVQMLQTKAVTRSRQFLLEKIQKFARPNTNIQILQQTLIKFSPLYQYIHQRTPSIGMGAGSPLTLPRKTDYEVLRHHDAPYLSSLFHKLHTKHVRCYGTAFSSPALIHIRSTM